MHNIAIAVLSAQGTSLGAISGLYMDLGNTLEYRLIGLLIEFSFKCLDQYNNYVVRLPGWQSAAISPIGSGPNPAFVDK